MARNVPWVLEIFLASNGELRACRFLRLDRNRKPRMKSLWHPAYAKRGSDEKKIGREERKREIGGICEQFLQAGPLGQTAERESRILHVVDQDQQYKLFPDNS